MSAWGFKGIVVSCSLALLAGGAGCEDDFHKKGGAGSGGAGAGGAGTGGGGAGMGGAGAGGGGGAGAGGAGMGGGGGGAGTGGAGMGGAGMGGAGAGGAGMGVAHTLFVATEGELTAYDLATGAEKPGAIADVASPTDLQAIETGHLLVNLTTRNEILIVDGRTMTEVRRVPSSTLGGTRPVHSYITPTIEGRRWWMTNNDGASGMLGTNSITFIDLVPSSPAFLMPIGETLLSGQGHHKATFSDAMHRVSISNIADCDAIVSVYDFSGLASGSNLVTTLETLTGAEAGVDAMSTNRRCDTMGRPGPHGAGTAFAAGRHYQNLTGWGALVSIDAHAMPPTFRVLDTTGTGAGYTTAAPGGRYVYSLQRTPREGGTGAACQVGQLLVIDGVADAVTASLPIGYRGPACAESVVGTAWENAGPDKILVGHDHAGKRRIFVTTQASPPTSMPMAEAYADQLVVFDISDPAMPVQEASVTVGRHSGHRAETLTGDGLLVLVPNSKDGSVSVVDAVTLQVVRTIATKPGPKTLASFGSVEGPSYQTGPRHD